MIGAAGPRFGRCRRPEPYGPCPETARQPLYGCAPTAQATLRQRLGLILHTIARGEVGSVVEHAAEKAAPIVAFRGRIVPERDNLITHVLSKNLVALIRPVQADKGQVPGQEAAMPQAVNCRHQLPRTQIAAGAKDHHCEGIGQLRRGNRRGLRCPGSRLRADKSYVRHRHGPPVAVGRSSVPPILSQRLRKSIGRHSFLAQIGIASRGDHRFSYVLGARKFPMA